MIYFLRNMYMKENLPFIVPLATGVVEGNAGLLYTSVTGAGVVTPKQIYLYTHL
jgi:hypothetical protein